MDYYVRDPCKSVAISAIDACLASFRTPYNRDARRPYCFQWDKQTSDSVERLQNRRQRGQRTNAHDSLTFHLLVTLDRQSNPYRRPELPYILSHEFPKRLLDPSGQTVTLLQQGETKPCR
jgi:hypothetical protein